MPNQNRNASFGASDTGRESARIVEAAAYLDQCWRSRSRFAIMIGQQNSALSRALRHFTDNLPETARLARTPAPTDSGHSFLESALAQFGFDPFDATADDLLRLLTVVLRQDAARSGTSIIIVEDAHLFGPRVWETIRELARNADERNSTLLFILSGSTALHRILDSSGMSGVAGMTRVRFDLDSERGDAGSSEGRLQGQADRGVSLLVSRDQQTMARFTLAYDRLLIGRGEHSDLRLSSRFVSRQHALLLRNTDGDWLIDLKSTNGTIVNSALIERHRLQAGDIISIGNFRLRYEDAAGSQPGPVIPMADPDLLTETVVMRSLKALREPVTDDARRHSREAGDKSSAA